MGTATLRVVQNHATVYRRVWKGSVITSFANPVLFLLAMGMGLGSLVDSGRGSGVGELSYLAFLAPGLLAATAMQVAAGQCTWPVMAGIKWQKTYHAALATPVGTGDLAAGHLLWTAVRILMATVVFAVVMVLFGAAAPLRALAAVAPALLTGMAFAAPITAFAASLNNDYLLSALFRFAIIPMFLFSGTFFPVTQLPAWSQPVAFATPLWHGVQLTRGIALDVATTFSPVVHVGYLLLWTGVGWALASWRFRLRLVT